MIEITINVIFQGEEDIPKTYKACAKNELLAHGEARMLIAFLRKGLSLWPGTMIVCEQLNYRRTI